MKTYKLFLIAFFTAALAFAQQADYTKEPGYFSFDKLMNYKSGDLITEVYLEEPLIKMVAKMAEGEKEGVGEAIDALKLIRVNEFMVEKNDIEKIEKEMASLDGNLQTQKWSRIIKTKKKDNYANVYVKSGGANEYVGLLIAAIDKEGKVTLVNIVGRIDLDTIGKVSKELNLPHMNKE
ncbi:MAG: DUF4252 domain-containing protein [Ignavibacteriales bacterium]|nr:DUF4252 domain-containing protein [Ignavibacteriales bacterium]